MSEAFVVDGVELLKWLHQCGLSPPSDLRRVVIDLEVGQCARVYYDKFAPRSLIVTPYDFLRQTSVEST